MRRCLSLLCAGATVLAAAVVLLASPASAASVPGGTYVATTPTRVLDTRHGTYGNRRGAVAPRRAAVVRVSGRSGVPASASAVAVTITVVSASRSGSITAAAHGGRRRPGVTNLQFRAGSTATGYAVVRTAAGRIDLWNASAGRVQLVMDVVGYYAGGRPTVDGALHLLSPRRAVDTRSGLHRFHRGALRAGQTLAANLHALAGLPTTAGAVAATVTVFDPRRSGSLIAYATRTTRPDAPLLDFTAGRASSQFTVLPISDLQGLSLRNSSAGSVQIAIDVVGYLTAGPAATARTTQVVAANRVFRDAGLPARRADRIPVLGRAGVPRAGVAAVTLAVRVRGPRRSGMLVGGTHAAPIVASFAARRSVSATVTLRVSRGAVVLRNTSAGALGLDVAVTGYVPSTTLSVPSTRSAARYPNDLTGEVVGDTVRMTAHGVADSGATFALLDLGAQSITAPLSLADPGVAIALTSPTVRLHYADLVTVIKGYVDGLATGGHPVTLAVGTNNDGTWTEYRAAARGRDFADDVIDPLALYAAPKGITVVGANDIEADFGTQRPEDAIAWENAYLAATGGDLIFNGALIGCPTVFGSTRDCGFGWTQKQYGTLTKRTIAGRNRIQVLPQIYFPVQAVQWANVSATNGGLRFAGSLTQHGADGTFTRGQGWAALQRALAVRVSTPSIPRTVDIVPDG